MTPSAWRDGGRGETIHWATAETDLGTMLVAATDKGICRLSFDEDDAALKRRFPNASISAGGSGMADLVRGTVAAVNAPEKPHDLPLDVHGTAFQEAVWRELTAHSGRRDPHLRPDRRRGRHARPRCAPPVRPTAPTMSPCSSPATASSAPTAAPGGYAYGLERKARLLERERRKA